MEDYKRKIDEYLNEAQNQFLRNSYGNSLDDLGKKYSDYKDFISAVGDFKVTTDQNPDDVQEYFFQRIKDIYKEFFG
ncbi:hypothetical protein PQ459_10315 [Chryseobacterium sp. KACC 21268]|nr:hypothetical protein PQ459_10315 [Chryseobacterium sp. KACC 21268]